MTPFHAITTVYSYYLPEIRAVIDAIARNYPHEVFLRSIKPGLDDFDQPIIDKLVAFHKADVPGLGGFRFRYPTSGSEEAIRELFTWLKARGVDQVYVLKGDYEGYKENAKTRNISVVEVEVETDPRSLKPGYWFLSDPSARDGMTLPPEFPRALCEAGHRVVYDLSYLGATPPRLFDVAHPNVVAALVSFSKAYGLFYYRIGFAFTREEVPSLYSNKWFKNIHSLLIAEKVIETLDPAALVRKYKSLQKKILGEINREHRLGLKASDAFLLAHLPGGDAAALAPEQLELIKNFKRHRGYRFCLTPYFQEKEAS